MLLLMLMSCQNRKKALQISEYRSAEIEKIDTNTVVSNEKAVKDRVEVVKKKDQKIKENIGDVVIKGKTDSIKDFRYSNVLGNDTISDIYISGNADFIIKNRWKQSEIKEIIEEKSDKINIVAEVARKVVAQSTIKEVASELKNKTLEVKKSGFSLPIYLIFGGVFLIIVILWFLWNKFGGSIINRINKLNK